LLSRCDVGDFARHNPIEPSRLDGKGEVIDADALQ